jgi:predicted outer membrane protein
VTPVRVITAVGVVAVLALAWAFHAELGFGSEPAADAAPATTAATPHASHSAPSKTALTADGTVSQKQAASSGPISELDKQLLVKVRQADLWELPAGRLAQDNASSETVKRAGQHLMEGHSRLDQIVRELSAALHVPIPNEATADQQGWVRTLQNSKGEAFDVFFANQLRDSHGKVFVTIAQVRATTQNSLIRDLAIEANKAVSDHMEVLEDTGLVKAQTLESVEKTVVTT